MSPKCRSNWVPDSRAGRQHVVTQDRMGQAGIRGSRAERGAQMWGGGRLIVLFLEVMSAGDLLRPGCV